MTEYAEPLTNEELRATAENGWAPHGARLATELIAARARIAELAAKRNPDDEVLVEGSWFHPDDLPKILGNFMRSSAHWAREAKDYSDELRAARERIAELEEDYAHLQNAFRAASDQAEALATDSYADSHRLAELEAFVADIACHGLRGDMNPTLPGRAPGEREAALLRYLRSLNDQLKAAARAFVPDADVRQSQGRPIPAPRVEVVAECVTELDVLRAQDGAQ